VKEFEKNIVIRKMLAGDMDAAMMILSQWNMAPVAPSPENPDPERSSIDIDNTFVAVCEGKIIGVASYIVISDTVVETASLAVDPDYQGSGIGYKLQKARLEAIYQRGIRKVRTETDRMETINWYKSKFGYRETGKNPKKHKFSLADMNEWTVLELNLDDYFGTGEKRHGRK
jgi:N-acetylglutamate synthase-like GNAT family acetyltransferase